MRHRHRGRRKSRWWKVTAVVVASALLAGAGLAVARAAGEKRPASARSAGDVNTTTTGVRSTTTPSTAPPTTTTTTNPGALPQTGTLPTTASPTFTARMAALWQGVSTGSGPSALPGFFPEPAYVQLKAIPSAQSDWTQRLVVEYEEDVAAAHQLLGPNAAAATLVGVDVDAAYAHWVPVGTCYNDVGYFEVPNSRVVYAINGQMSSFGIASMISWRGEWYVVHLGAILRSGRGGEVDRPQPGPGAPTYSSTC
ncbi:MAG TPA: hypothetical protein VGY51_12770 [Acidimicrobiales bacterium]|nr:hypothetical protein [Acidimicrobiales bacterium]